MYTHSEYVTEQINRDTRDRAFQEAENLRMLRQAGALRPNPLTRAFRFTAVRLGRVLVALGQILVRVDGTANPILTTTGCD